MDTLNSGCWLRPCFQPGEDKGTFAIGKGYTSYHNKPKPCCMQRHLHGCPSPIPEIDPEQGRCCYRALYKKKHTAPAGWKTCETCGNQEPKGRAAVLNALPQLAGVPCKHEDLRNEIVKGWYKCFSCWGIWDHKPRTHEVSQYSREELYAKIDSILSQL